MIKILRKYLDDLEGWNDFWKTWPKEENPKGTKQWLWLNTD